MDEHEFRLVMRGAAHPLRWLIGRADDARPSRRLACCALLLVTGVAQGQTIESLDRARAEQERLKRLIEERPAAYVDRVMDDAPLPAGDDPSNPEPDAGGLRSYFAETRVAGTRSDNGLALRMSRELGQRVGFRMQTLNHGEFVLEADARRRNGDPTLNSGTLGLATRDATGRFVLRNLGFPLTPTTLVDTAIGDVSTEITSGLSRTYRISLGSNSVRGASMRLGAPGFDLRAGTGERGLLAGGPVAGFEAVGGRSSWVGFSRAVGRDTAFSAQVNRSTGPITTQLIAVTPSQQDVDTVSSAVGMTHNWARAPDRTLRGRLIALHSDADEAGQRGRSQGYFVEGTFSAPRHRQEFGLFSADTGLRFGETLVTTANRGVYWRIDQSSLRWFWGAGVDVSEQDQGLTSASRRLGLAANASWRIDRSNSVYVNLSVAQSRFAALSEADTARGNRSANLGLAWRTQRAGWGLSTLRLTVQRNEVLVSDGPAATGEQLEWEQDWITGRFETLRPEFRTTLGLARDRSAGRVETQPTAGLVFRLWPGESWSVGGTLRYTARDTNLATSRGLAGTLDAEWNVAEGWRAGAALQLNQAKVQLPATATDAATLTRSDEKYLSVYLRWDGSAGRSARGLGATDGLAGAGGINGLVFFDANRDGEQQAGESGVPEVEVFLDGRYRTLTDRAGRFTFPLVGVGVHQLTLTPESVPLPWGPAAEAPVKVEVPLRGTATPSLPVVRLSQP